MLNKLICFFTLIFFSCTESVSLNSKKGLNFGIVIHGGVGTMNRKDMTPKKEKEYREALEESITSGYKILKDGGTSQEAVEQSIRIMENSPLFNAGKGAVLTAEKTIELDAAFMNGKDLNAGAIASVKTIKNPITAAIKVMEESPHVLLSGRGAEKFAKEKGIEIVDPSYFFTERRENDLDRIKSIESSANTSPKQVEKEFLSIQKYGTVGAVALDKHGNLAAGTSTGGMTNKKWNRIGDVPIIGAGTYANNSTCAISATGWGEFFIRNVVGHDISALMEYKNYSIEEAARIVIHDKVAALGGDGGVIGIDKDGNVVMEMNTSGMYRAHINSEGELTIEIYDN